MGRGATTGRGAGYCAGFGLPGYANPVPGRGVGFGCGFGGRGGGGGRGRRNRFFATGLTGWQRAGVTSWTDVPVREEELAALKNQADRIGGTLDAIRKRIGELEGAGDDKE